MTAPRDPSDPTDEYDTMADYEEHMAALGDPDLEAGRSSDPEPAPTDRVHPDTLDDCRCGHAAYRHHPHRDRFTRPDQTTYCEWCGCRKYSPAGAVPALQATGEPPYDCPDEPPTPETRHRYCPGCLRYFGATGEGEQG